jgi:Mlc titration factor MtfA (ptsG expression regulator)
MHLFRKHRRAELRARAAPFAWREILVRNVPYYRRLPETDRAELAGHMQIFLDEKHFEGCGGLELTDEMKVTIAGEACLLLLHRETDYYPGLESILVYPSAYVVPVGTRLPGGLIGEDAEVRLGESWAHGALVLSWDSVLGATGPGHNVVLHEFAHQLDLEDGFVNGAPGLPRRSMYTTWASVLGGEYAELVAASEEHRQTIIDTYGAKNPAEFFAVVTEAFFEKPHELQQKHRALYEQLQLYYRQDPAALPAAAPDQT